MGVVVSFDYNAWLARYPEFSAVTQPTAQAYFNEATIYQRNDGGGPVSNATIQLTLLNMLTAHIAARYSQSQGEAQPGQPKDANSPVGRVSDITVGSVSVRTENDYPPGSAQWFQQTKYGSDWWQATAIYRTMRYVPGSSWGGRFMTPGVRGCLR